MNTEVRNKKEPFSLFNIFFKSLLEIAGSKHGESFGEMTLDFLVTTFNFYLNVRLDQQYPKNLQKMLHLVYTNHPAFYIVTN